MRATYVCRELNLAEGSHRHNVTAHFPGNVQPVILTVPMPSGYISYDGETASTRITYMTYDHVHDLPWKK
jgi:hypothetical protein